MNLHQDTITAIATPLGEGGISIIRISGPEAIGIANSRFKGKKSLVDVPTHTAHFGEVVTKEGKEIDEVVATVFCAPHSYTAENVVEISCHGGIYNTQRILDEIVSAGARLAHPGEFTKRAFLNGRIDLSQAEAVADLIHARSEMLHKTSLEQLGGRLSTEIKSLREKLVNICSLLELELDFSEEGLEFIDKQKIAKDIDEVKVKINMLIDSFRLGKIYRDGVKVVLAGKPNVGKSSILNGLLNKNRAIVTSIPGTTRDVITESIDINGTIFEVHDTAGLREVNDEIESEGIKRTESILSASDIILFVIDGANGFTKEDEEILQKLITSQIDKQSKIIILQNKIDLNRNNILTSEIIKNYSLSVIPISAKTGDGFDCLRTEIYDTTLKEIPRSQEKSIVVTNVRHRDSLKKSIMDLDLALKGIRQNITNELLAPDIRASINSLSEIVGEVTTEDILDNIFAQFCIGK